MTKKFLMLATVAALFVACGSADTEAMEQQSQDAANQELLDQAAAEAEAAAAEAEAAAAAAAAEAEAAEEATEETKEGDDK